MTLADKGLRFLRESLLENLMLKAVSFALAIGFYAFLHGAQNAQRTFSLSVVALLAEGGSSRTLLTPPPATVRVTLRGSRTVLDDLKADDLGTVQLDAHKGHESYATFDASRLKIPAGVTAIVEPPGIDLVWDDVTTRPLPIQISVTGQPAAGFAVQGQPRAEPSAVAARGPRTLLETLQHARAEPFDVGGLTEGTFPRKLVLDPPSSGVTYDTTTTQVTVSIGRARLDRVFVKLPVQVVGVARAVSVPPEVDVRVSGPPEVVNALRPEQIVPTADVRAAGQDTKTGGSASITVSVGVEGCRSQVVPGAVVVKW
jgi:hypothetical protein